MKKLLLLIITVILFTSCKDMTDKVFKTDTFELRQLVNNEVLNQKTYGSYFLITASYRSETERNDIVKVFAKVDGAYRLIKFNLEDVRIVIDNSLTKPYLQYKYTFHKQLTNDKVIEFDEYDSDFVPIIHCAEKYLPERLLQIDITK